MPNNSFRNRIGPMIPAAGVFVALIAGLAVAASPVGGLALLAATLVGVAALVLPADWVSAGSLVAVSAFAALVPVNALVGLVTLGPLSGPSVLALFSVALAALAFLRVGPKALVRGGRITALAGTFFFVFAFVTVVGGSDGLGVALAQWSIWASAFVLAVCTSRRLIPVVIAAWITLGFLEGAYAVYEFFARPTLLYEGYLAEDYRTTIAGLGGGASLPRAQATFGHPIPLASFLITTFALAVWAIRSPSGGRLPLVRSVALVVILMGTVATLSRSGWVALAVAVGVGLASRRTTNFERIRVAALFVVPAVVLTQTSLGGDVVSYVSNLGETASYEQRAASLRAVPQILGVGLMTAIFGAGASSQQGLYEAIGSQSAGGLWVIDNQYVTLLAETGLLGLGVFLALAASAFGLAWRSMSANPSSPDAGMIWGVGVALLTVLTAIFFYDGLGWPSTAILVWSLFGFLARYNGDRDALPRGVHPDEEVSTSGKPTAATRSRKISVPENSW